MVEIEIPAVCTVNTSTPTRPSLTRSCYAQARSVLRLSSSQSSSEQALPLLGRDSQREAILSFMSGNNDTTLGFQLRKGGALYVSGQPGTGKTALINDILEHSLPASISRLSINCATIKGVQIWEAVLDGVNGSPAALKGLRARKKLEELVQKTDAEPL